jgi:hypothetical protein
MEKKYRIKAYQISKPKNKTKLLPITISNLEREAAIEMVEKLKKESSYCHISWAEDKDAN